MVTHSCNPNILEAEAGGSPVQSKPGAFSETLVSSLYRPPLKHPKCEKDTINLMAIPDSDLTLLEPRTHRGFTGQNYAPTASQFISGRDHFVWNILETERQIREAFHTGWLAR